MRQEVCWINVYEKRWGERWHGRCNRSRQEADDSACEVQESKLLYRIKATRKY